MVDYTTSYPAYTFPSGQRATYSSTTATEQGQHSQQDHTSPYRDQSFASDALSAAYSQQQAPKPNTESSSDAQSQSQLQSASQPPQYGPLEVLPNSTHEHSDTFGLSHLQLRPRGQQPPFRTRNPTLPYMPAPPPGTIPQYTFGNYPLTEADHNAPKLGQTRCYWTLLSSSLTFVFIDPVLQLHIGSHAPGLAGRCILDFVHPDEQDSARKDLREVLNAKEASGSVTRVRFLRLKAIYLALGASSDELPFWTDQDRVAFDEWYIAIDLVINWVAQGLVLCFMHAVVDLSLQDHDESHKTDWTNWCGASLMDERHSAGLNKALQTPYLMNPPYSSFNAASDEDHSSAGSPSSSRAESSFHRSREDSYSSFRSPPTTTTSTMPERIFQVLQNDDSRKVLCSYPTSGYIAEDFADLATGVTMMPHVKGETADGFAKTNCTRRVECHRTVVDRLGGGNKRVGSLYVPHGRIIFACHNVQQSTNPMEAQYCLPRVLKSPDTSRRPSLPYSNQRTKSQDDSPMDESDDQSSAYQYQSSSTAARFTPAAAASDPYADHHHYSSDWPANQSLPSHARRSYSASDSSSAFHPDQRPSVAHTRSSSQTHYGTGTGLGGSQQAGSAWPTGFSWHQPPLASESSTSNSLGMPPSMDVITPTSAGSSHSLADYAASSQTASVPSSAPPSGHSYFPSEGSPPGRPSRSHSQSVLASPSAVKRTADEMLYGRRTSLSGDDGSVSPHGRHVPSSAPSQTTQYGAPHVEGSMADSGVQEESPRVGTMAKPLIPTSREPCGSRLNGNPPPGVQKCVSCGIENSPEWRKGENGQKNLCNACGLRYARSKQKKEGVLPQRRKKKDKADGDAKPSKKTAKARRRNDGSKSPPAHDAGSGPEQDAKQEDNDYYAPSGQLGSTGFDSSAAALFSDNRFDVPLGVSDATTRSYFSSTGMPMPDQNSSYGSYVPGF